MPDATLTGPAYAVEKFSLAEKLNGTIRYMLPIGIVVFLVVGVILLGIATQAVIFILGMFLGPIPIILITVPIFFPMIVALGFDQLWYGVLFLINIEISPISPPFGLSLFVMQSVAPAGTRMTDIWKATMPFILLDIVALALVMAFPGLALWLPEMMHYLLIYVLLSPMEPKRTALHCRRL